MSLIADETLRSSIIPGTNPSLSDESLAKSLWTELPDNLLLHVFCFLSPKEVLRAGEVCRNWYRLSKDELLWKSFLQDTLYKTANRKNVHLPNSSSWFAEFQRIHVKTPVVESQVLKEHTDEVLHVAFSHDGQLLASSSKDRSVILWRVDDCNHVSIAQKINFHQHNWEYVQFCEFNASDTLLLVSGVTKKRRHVEFAGEIFIYKLQGSSMGSYVHSSANEAYALFGAWLSERCYVSGTLEVTTEPAWNDGQSLFSQLWANFVGELPEHQKNQRISKLVQVVNHDCWTVTLVHIARPNISSQSVYSSTTLQWDGCVCLICTYGTVTNALPHQIMFKWLKLPHDLNSHGGRESCIGSCSRPDYCIETNAQIIGISLSPDHHYLYVNCRLFQQQNDESGNKLDESENPEISNDITLQVYNLSTYELVGVHIGHQAYSSSDYCFFVYSDVADKLVASGAEDHCAHVWDRHFGAKLATLKGHSDIVNCVAFNPVNQEMLVSASDDHTIRVWKSRQLSKANHKSSQENKLYGV